MPGQSGAADLQRECGVPLGQQGPCRRGEPQLILALFSGHLTTADATDLGLEVSGDASVLRRVLPEPVTASLSALAVRQGTGLAALR